ncbi:Gfo/Idh/MocA family protein [Pirellulaceae bacterium SH449]
MNRNKKTSRRRFLTNLAATSALVTTAANTSPSVARSFAMANDEIRLGFISCGGRANEHLSTFTKFKGAAVTALCDPDSTKVERARSQFAPQAKGYADLRNLIDDPNVDAVVIATCNHWHCLAAIWAMQAGKDVYVEKPLSHSQWEGQQTIAAARKYNRICQVGTQQRSDPMQAEIKAFLHEEKGIGEILTARVNRYGVRKSIGLRSTPLPIDPKIDYDLWLGPAQDRPIFRENFHYDWHWDFNTGSGEMGNWGVHVLDDLRNNVFLDKVNLPKRIFGGGGRVVWNDAGETPNVHFVYFDTGSIPVVIGLSNLTAGTDSDKQPRVKGPGSGYIAFGQGGRLEGQRGGAVAYDSDGKEMKRFRGNSGNGLHQENFLNAIRSRDPSMLAADVQVGHDSTGWCNLANIVFQTGEPFSLEAAGQVELPEWRALVGEMKDHLAAHSLDIEDANVRISKMLEFDPAKEIFVGNGSQDANKYLKREYRAPYVVPEIS